MNIISVQTWTFLHIKRVNIYYISMFSCQFCWSLSALLTSSANCFMLDRLSGPQPLTVAFVMRIAVVTLLTDAKCDARLTTPQCHSVQMAEVRTYAVTKSELPAPVIVHEELSKVVRLFKGTLLFSNLNFDNHLQRFTAVCNDSQPFTFIYNDSQPFTVLNITYVLTTIYKQLFTTTKAIYNHLQQFTTVYNHWSNLQPFTTIYNH